MAKQKIWICLFTVILLLCVVAVGAVQGRQQVPPFCVEISGREQTEVINLWESELGEYYVFLPSYIQPQQVKIHLNVSNAVSINGIHLKDGLTCDAFQPNVAYELTYDAWGKHVKKSITFLYSENVATMYINTPSQSMAYIHSKKGNSETAEARIYTADGVGDYCGSLDEISGRGNSTWTYSDKKGYSVSTAEEVDLLGMGKAQKWILLANGLDQSNLRNKIIYEFAQNIGLPYTPEIRWVDLYLNGEYAGLYLLCERIEVHPERVDISHESSFLISSELKDRLQQQNHTYLLTDTGLAMRIHSATATTEATMARIAEKWQSVENAILAEDGIDYVTGKSWMDLIDLDSWARKYLIDEVFGNCDAYTVSQYYYYDGNEANGKVYAGPVWDYDASLGNPWFWQLGNPYSLFCGNNRFKPGIETPLIHALTNKKEFRGRVEELYAAEFFPKIESLLTNEISAYVGEIDKSTAMDQIRWSTPEDVFYHQEYIIKYLSDRNAFLHSLWVEGAVYHRVVLDPGNGNNYAYFAVLSGECLDELPVLEANEAASPLGKWYYADTDEPFDITKPITEDIEIYTKWQSRANNKFSQAIKLVPLFLIAVLGILLLTKEHILRKRHGDRYGR